MSPETRKELLFKVLIMAAVALVTVWRQPELFYLPRFYAEEGAGFFSYAFNHTWLENLLHPRFGYYTLFNLLSTSLAAAFPVESAPLVTTYAAFFLQMAVSFTVLQADIPELDSPLRRGVTALSIPLLPYVVIWLNTLGAQYMLCVITFLLLLETPVCRTRPAAATRGLVLVLAGLTGVVSCFLTPSFLYKALRTGSKQFAAYGAVLGCCSLFQTAVFLQARAENDPGLAARFVHHDIYTLAGIFGKFMEFNFFIPFFGRDIRVTPLFLALEETIRSVIPPLAGYDKLVIPSLAGGVIFLFIVLLVYKSKDSLNARVAMLSFALVAFLSTLFSINMSGGPRYTFAPSVMLIVMCVAKWRMEKTGAWLRYSGAALICCMFISNGSEGRFDRLGIDIDSWPKWREEVRQWRMDSRYRPKIWPPPWEVTLEK